MVLYREKGLNNDWIFLLWIGLIAIASSMLAIWNPDGIDDEALSVALFIAYIIPYVIIQTTIGIIVIKKISPLLSIMLMVSVAAALLSDSIGDMMMDETLSSFVSAPTVCLGDICLYKIWEHVFDTANKKPIL